MRLPIQEHRMLAMLTALMYTFVSVSPKVQRGGTILLYADYNPDCDFFFKYEDTSQGTHSIHLCYLNIILH